MATKIRRFQTLFLYIITKDYSLQKMKIYSGSLEKRIQRLYEDDGTLRRAIKFERLV